CLAFFFQAEDGIRDKLVTGVQTCALPILQAAVAPVPTVRMRAEPAAADDGARSRSQQHALKAAAISNRYLPAMSRAANGPPPRQIGRASCRERVYISVQDEGVRRRDVKTV